MIKDSMGQDKKEVLESLRNADEVFVIISGCTHLPFVICDEETYDDQILLYRKAEDAQTAGKLLQREQNPIQIAKLLKPQYLGFYSTLYTMGVNCVYVDRGTSSAMQIQLPEIVTRREDGKASKGTVRVENPELHLTAIYFMQKLKAGIAKEGSQELTELREEMMTHFKEGRYIAAVQEGKGVPVLKLKNGDTYQPLFTDMAEFVKFKQKNEFKTAVVDFDAIPKMLAPEALGVVINPFGVNLQFQINRDASRAYVERM